MEWIGRFVKEYGWLGTVIAAIATAIWAVTTYLQNARREYVKEFNTKQVTTFFTTAETVSSLVAENDAAKWNEPRRKLLEAALWRPGDLRKPRHRVRDDLFRRQAQHHPV